jgi:hypothetical protein
MRIMGQNTGARSSHALQAPVNRGSIRQIAGRNLQAIDQLKIYTLQCAVLSMCVYSEMIKVGLKDVFIRIAEGVHP